MGVVKAVGRASGAGSEGSGEVKEAEEGHVGTGGLESRQRGEQEQAHTWELRERMRERVVWAVGG